MLQNKWAYAFVVSIVAMTVFGVFDFLKSEFNIPTPIFVFMVVFPIALLSYVVHDRSQPRGK